MKKIWCRKSRVRLPLTQYFCLCGSFCKFWMHMSKNATFQKFFLHKVKSYLFAKTVPINIRLNPIKFCKLKALTNYYTSRQIFHLNIYLKKNNRMQCSIQRVFNDLWRTRLSRCRMIWLIPNPPPHPFSRQQVVLGEGPNHTTARMPTV